MIETEPIKTELEIIQEKMESLVARNKMYITIAVIFLGTYFLNPSIGIQMLILPISLFLFSVINYYEIQKHRKELKSKAIKK